MKKRLPILLAALMLLSGCAHESSSLPSIGESTSVPTLQTDLPDESKSQDETVPGFTTESVLQPGETEEETQAPTKEHQKQTPSESGSRPTEPKKSDTEQTQPPAQQTEPPKKETEAPQTQPSETTPPPTEGTQPPETEGTIPSESKPEETEPAVTVPAETKPAAEKIDTAQLETHARSYAYHTYGYEGDASLNLNNAGYFPGVRIYVETMADGYAAAERAVDDQYRSDMSMGYNVVEIIDGVECRAKINVYFEPTDDPNAFILWCFYG